VSTIYVTFHFQHRSIHSITLPTQPSPDPVESFLPPGGNFGNDMSVISKLNQATFTTHSEIRFGSDLIADVVRTKQGENQIFISFVDVKHRMRR
jgi:hypothetical protein